MIELIQFPYSPYCIVQRRILEYSGKRFKITNIENGDRSLIWKLTKERYYQVPVLSDGKQVLFETGANTQVIAKYLDQKFELGLFPQEWRGIQSIVWQHLENEVEGVGFKLNDIYYEKFVPKADQWAFVRHKERKFGAGCLTAWRENQMELLGQMTELLVPYEQMLLHKKFLLDDRPRFVDFDLYGMLGNFLYTKKYQLPKDHTNLRSWYRRMTQVKAVSKPTA